jgi:hypothetical protein
MSAPGASFAEQIVVTGRENRVDVDQERTVLLAVALDEAGFLQVHRRAFEWHRGAVLARDGQIHGLRFIGAQPQVEGGQRTVPCDEHGLDELFATPQALVSGGISAVGCVLHRHPQGAQQRRQSCVGSRDVPPGHVPVRRLDSVEARKCVQAGRALFVPHGVDSSTCAMPWRGTLSQSGRLLSS